MKKGDARQLLAMPCPETVFGIEVSVEGGEVDEREVGGSEASDLIQIVLIPVGE